MLSASAWACCLRGRSARMLASSSWSWRIMVSISVIFLAWSSTTSGEEVVDPAASFSLGFKSGLGAALGILGVGFPEEDVPRIG